MPHFFQIQIRYLRNHKLLLQILWSTELKKYQQWLILHKKPDLCILFSLQNSSQVLYQRELHYSDHLHRSQNNYWLECIRSCLSYQNLLNHKWKWSSSHQRILWILYWNDNQLKLLFWQMLRSVLVFYKLCLSLLQLYRHQLREQQRWQHPWYFLSYIFLIPFVWL